MPSSTKNKSYAKKLTSTFKENAFIKNATILLSGTFLSQILPLVFSPLITRLYSPEQFGTFGVITSIFTIIVTIASGRYEMAIILPKMKRKAVELAYSGMLFAVLISLLCFVSFLFLKENIAHYFNIFDPKEINLFLTIPFFVLCMGLYNPINYWMVREKKFKSISTGKMVQTTGIVCFTVIMGLAGYTSGLLVGYLIAWIIYVIFSFFQANQEKFFTVKLSLARIIDTAKNYKDFPLYNSLSAILIAISQTVSVFFIQKYFTKEDTGHFFQCRQYVLVPLSLLTIAISQVFIEEIGAKVRQKQSVLKFIKKMFGISVLIGTIIILVVLLIAPDVFQIFFGSEWRISGVYLQVLIFSYVIQSIVVPFGNILNLLNKSKHTLIFPVIYFISLLTYLKFAPNDVFYFIIGLTILEVTVYGIYFLISYRLLKGFEKNTRLPLLDAI